MKCEGFAQITDLADYLNNNRLIAHYGGFNIMESLPSYWTYDRFLRQVDNSALKPIMASWCGSCMSWAWWMRLPCRQGLRCEKHLQHRE